jgi:general secretion pathway protein H
MGSRGAMSEDGFTLLEMVCVIAIVAMLAAVLLPNLSHGTSRPRLEAYAIETAALLKSDRTAAIRHRAPISTQVDAQERRLRSGWDGRMLEIPEDVTVSAMLPIRCNERAARSTITFFATGMSCGGVIVLSRLGTGYEIRVNWLTGGIEIAPRAKL